jgi:poly-gamma-glutamate synthesis protein (capsule biosynthesis protein)
MIRTNINIVLVFALAVVLFFFWRYPALAPGERSGLGLPVVRSSLVSVVAVGDIMLSRHVGAKIDEAGDPSLPFAKVKEILDGADITFGNLECPLSSSDIPIREGLVFRCLTKYVSGLKNAGFDVLSTANNHSFDQGPDNLEFTIDYLKSVDILPVGTFKQSQLSNSMELDSSIKKGDTIFGFLSYSYTARNDGGKSRHDQIATMHDLEQLKSDIQNLEPQSDIVVVSMHAGTEYVRTPNAEQVSFAHAAIDAGADVVIGHHPHWVQTIEIYRGKPVFYSLGNFVFDQMWSQDTREGLMIRLNIKDKKLKNAELLPVVIDNYCCPRPADEAESQAILEKIGRVDSVIRFGDQ